MTKQAVESTSAEPRGVAGYASPYPYLDRLQEKMNERLDRKVPARGRYCGFCYGRLREADTRCGFCGTAVSARSPVADVPQDVLGAYLARKRTEARWVYGGAFAGLIFASMLFLVLVVWGPGLLGHPAVGFAVLIGGGYLLAQAFGPFIGGQVGYRRGSRKRDAVWTRFLRERDG